jgi:LysM repeat protein
MKRIGMILASLAAVVLLAVQCFAGEDTSQNEYLVIAAPANYTNGTMYSIAEGAATTNTLDISPYKGRGVVVVSISADLTGVATTNVTPVFLQHSTSATGTYSTVSGVTFAALSTAAQVTTANVDTQILKKYLRLGVTLLGTNAVQRNISAVYVVPHLSD